MTMIAVCSSKNYLNIIALCKPWPNYYQPPCVCLSVCQYRVQEFCLCVSNQGAYADNLADAVDLL